MLINKEVNIVRVVLLLLFKWHISACTFMHGVLHVLIIFLLEIKYAYFCKSDVTSKQANSRDRISQGTEHDSVVLKYTFFFR